VTGSAPEVERTDSRRVAARGAIASSAAAVSGPDDAGRAGRGKPAEGGSGLAGLAAVVGDQQLDLVAGDPPTAVGLVDGLLRSQPNIGSEGQVDPGERGQEPDLDRPGGQAPGDRAGGAGDEGKERAERGGQEPGCHRVDIKHRRRRCLRCGWL